MKAAMHKRKTRPTLKQWVRMVNEMADEVERWALERDWSVYRDKKVIEEEGRKYEAPVIRVRSAAGEVWFDPVGSDILGADGRIDLVYWPGTERVRLILRGGDWQAIKENDERIRRKWGRSLFHELAGNPPPVWG